VSKVYDVVVLDSSPLLSVVDTLEILPHVDGVLMCVRAARTTRDQARAAKSALEHFPARPTGIVVTDVSRGEDEDYGFYSYAYAYGQKPSG
jgi:Mrp family chromosome partitioning ATPase